MVNLLNPMLMGPAQRLQGAQPAFAPQATAGAFPAAQSPMAGIGERLRGFLAPEIALPAAAAMMQAPDFGSSIGGAFGAMGQGLAAQRAKQEAEQKRNATLEYFKRTRPDLYEAVAVGMDPGDAFKLAMSGGPDLTDDLKEYDYARRQGYGGSFTDYMTEMRKAGATTVNVGDGSPGLGKLSTDYGYVLDPQTGQPRIDPNTGLPMAAPVPGSPAAREMQQAQDAVGIKQGTQTTKADTILTAAQKARELIGATTTGTPGRVIGNVLSESNAAELRRQAAVLKSNATIENLQAMRAASPTGGALGNVSDAEGAMLAAAAGALDPNAGPAQFKQQLDNYERTLLRIIHGPEVGDAIFEQTRAQDGWTDLGNGVRIRKLD